MDNARFITHRPALIAEQAKRGGRASLVTHPACCQRNVGTAANRFLNKPPPGWLGTQRSITAPLGPDKEDGMHEVPASPLMKRTPCSCSAGDDKPY